MPTNFSFWTPSGKNPGSALEASQRSSIIGGGVTKIRANFQVKFKCTPPLRVNNIKPVLESPNNISKTDE